MREYLISRIPMGKLGNGMMYLAALPFCLQDPLLTLLVKQFMLMVGCICLDNEIKFFNNKLNILEEILNDKKCKRHS